MYAAFKAGTSFTMMRPQARINTNKLLVEDPIVKRVNYAHKRFQQSITIHIYETRSMCSMFGSNVVSAIKRKMILCNDLFLEPDGEEETENYSYHSSLLARLITVFTKKYWPTSLPDPCIRFAQLNNGSNKLRMQALFWESEKHCNSGEKTCFSFTIEVTSRGLRLSDLKNGHLCKKAVLKSTASALSARKKDAARRHAQNTNNVTATIFGCCLPKRSDTMAINLICDNTEEDLSLPIKNMTISPFTSLLPLGS